MKRGLKLFSFIFLIGIFLVLSMGIVSAGLLENVGTFFKHYFGNEDVLKAPGTSPLASYTIKLMDTRNRELPKNKEGQYQIGRGRDFFVNVYVTDLRASRERKGIFAAYASVITRSNLIRFTPRSLAVSSTLSPRTGAIINKNGESFIDKAGGVHKDALITSSINSFLLLKVKARALTKGTESIGFVPVTLLPQTHQTLLRGNNNALSEEEIAYGVVEVSIK